MMLAEKKLSRLLDALRNGTTGQFLVASNIVLSNARTGFLTKGKPQLETRIKTGKLLEILEENRRKHHEVFQEAMKNYREAAIKELHGMIADAIEGRRIRRAINLVQPINQTADYDRVISMLKLTEDDTIILDETQFRCYVQDKWHWASQFSSSNKSYVTSGSSMAYINKMEGQEEDE